MFGFNLRTATRTKLPVTRGLDLQKNSQGSESSRRPITISSRSALFQSYSLTAFNAGKLSRSRQVFLVFDFAAGVDRLMRFPEFVIPHTLSRCDSRQILHHVSTAVTRNV